MKGKKKHPTSNEVNFRITNSAPAPTPCHVIELWQEYSEKVVEHALPRFDYKEWPPMGKVEFRHYMRQAFYGGVTALLGALVRGGALEGEEAKPMRLALSAEMAAYIKQEEERLQ